MRVIPIVKAETLIPKGIYCYTFINTPEAKEVLEKEGVFKVKLCPFWEYYDEAKHGKLPEDWVPQGDSGGPGAYCRYLKAGDWEEQGTFLLWDQCKECGINADWDENNENF